MMRFALPVALSVSALAASSGAGWLRAQAPPRDVVARPKPAQPNDPRPAGGSISGRVLTDGPDSGMPIAKARVELIGETLTTVWMFTDSLGQFEFTSVPAGTYTLVADKSGYAVTTYGARGGFDPPLRVLVANRATETIEIRMLKGAAIAGRVVDEAGDPIVGARVSPLVVRSEGTARRLESAGRLVSETDDRGEYRLGGLAAGQYLLQVMTERNVIEVTPSFRRIGWARTLFPASVATGGTAPVTLGAGEERSGVDIVRPPFRPAELSVSVIAAPDPALRGATTVAEAVRLGVDPAVLRAVPQGRLRFFAGDTPDVEVPLGTVPFSSLGGASSGLPLLSIDPGPWTLIVRKGRDGAIAHLLLSPSETATASLTLRPPSRLIGQLVFDGTARRPASSSVRLDVIGAGPDAGISPLELAPSGPFAPKPDGTFDIQGILGTIELLIEAPGWSVSRIEAGDRDLLGRPITFEGGETLSGVRIVLSDQVAELDGTLRSSDGRPAPACSIVVFPASADVPFDRYRMQLERADLQGRFSVRDLPPGAYLAAAGSDIDAGQWTSPAVLDRLRTRAVPFTLGPREKKALTLPCAGAR